MRQLGVDVFYVVNFTKQLSMLSPEEFVENFIIKINAKHVIAGFDFTYGYRGRGTMETLIKEGKGHFEVTTFSKVSQEGEKVSSTFIRNLISKGKVREIKKYLGSEYETEGVLWDTFKHESQIPLFKCFTFSPTHSCMLPRNGGYLVEVQVATSVIPAVAEVTSIIEKKVAIVIKLWNNYKLINNEKVKVKWIERLGSRELLNFQSTYKESSLTYKPAAARGSGREKGLFGV